MKKILLCLISLFSLSYASIGCNCIILTEFGQIIEDNDQIFIGKVLGIDKSVSPVQFEFQVEEKWKGELESKTTITTSTGDCAVDFQIGETYIVYAKKYFTTICRRNGLLKESFDHKLLDHYFLGKPISKKLELSDMDVIATKVEQEKSGSNYMVLFDYRVLYPKEIYKLHPKLFNKNGIEIFILNNEEQQTVGDCIDKIIVMGSSKPKKGWSRKKVINAAKRRKICKNKT